MARPVKILLLQFSSIGDVVLTTPVVRCLKKQLANVELHYCTKQAFEPIIAYNPYIAKQHYLEDNLYELIRQLRREQFDYVVDLQNTVTTHIIKLALATRTYSLKRDALRRWLYMRWKLNTLSDQHIVDRYMAVVQPLGIDNDGRGLDYFIPYKDEVEIDWLPDTHREDFVTYTIGGEGVTRRLPLQRMIDLCRKLDYPIILLGNKEDRNAGEEIVRVLGQKQIFNACGLFNLNQSASLLRRSRVVFSHDTGLMHVAAAFRKKVYTIWGSTTPQLGFYPYKTPYVRIENQSLECRPCSAVDGGACPLKHFKCMHNLPFAFDVRELRKKKTNFD